MENDEEKNINLIIKNDHTSTSVFKLEYIEQNMIGNLEYQKWKEIMLIKFGNNSKQYKCNKDKILFYSTYDECINDPYYRCKCPICNNYICYFCSCYSKSIYISCCIKNSIFKSFFNSGRKAIKQPFDNLFSLYPYISIFFMIVFFFKLLYLAIITEKSKNHDNENEELEQYIDAEKNPKQGINITIVGFTDFLLCIPFAFISMYFIILLIIISIPFKFAPLKYYLGVVFSPL